MKTLREVIDDWAGMLALSRDDLDELEDAIEGWIKEGSAEFARAQGTDIEGLMRRLTNN